MGVSYFFLFWFGGDAVRYLRPHGGYDLFHLYPNFLVDFLVIVGALPDIPRTLRYDNLDEDPHA